MLRQSHVDGGGGGAFREMTNYFFEPLSISQNTKKHILQLQACYWQYHKKSVYDHQP